jgi:hypothetical protein
VPIQQTQYSWQMTERKQRLVPHQAERLADAWRDCTSEEAPRPAYDNPQPASQSMGPVPPATTGKHSGVGLTALVYAIVAAARACLGFAAVTVYLVDDASRPYLVRVALDEDGRARLKSRPARTGCRRPSSSPTWQQLASRQLGSTSSCTR